MAVSHPDSTVMSYGDVSRKDDVLGLIEILTAKEEQIFNKLGKTSAIDTVHSTLIDTLRTPASQAVAENGDYTMLTRTTPTRLTNLVQIVAVPFRVSRTQQQIEHYHGQNELTRQTTKAMMEWANSAEFDLVRSSLVSGQSGVAPKMAGIIYGISKSTNTTVQSSGTTWSASILKGLMKANWENGNGEVATDVYMGAYLKDVTDGFTNKSTIVNTGVNVREIIDVVDVLESGFGKVAIHLHRYIQQSSDATGRVLAIRPEKLKVAMLQAPKIDTDLARSGDYDERAVVGKFTLEVKNQDSNWFASGYNIG